MMGNNLVQNNIFKTLIIFILGDLGPGVIGNCEMTGFTENNKTEETLEGRPDACHCNHDLFGAPHLNSRPTGISIYNTHFLPLSIPNGREPLPNIDLRAAVSNGFTKCNKVVPDFVEIHPIRVNITNICEYYHKTITFGILKPFVI